MNDRPATQTAWDVQSLLPIVDDCVDDLKHLLEIWPISLQMIVF
jgi:hypothetical protein